MRACVYVSIHMCACAVYAGVCVSTCAYVCVRGMFMCMRGRISVRVDCAFACVYMRVRVYVCARTNRATTRQQTLMFCCLLAF